MTLDAASTGWIAAWADVTARLFLPFALARGADALLGTRLGAHARMLLYAPLALQWLVPAGSLPPIPTVPPPSALLAPASIVATAPEGDATTLHLPALWAFGVLLLALRAAAIGARFRRALASARPAPELATTVPVLAHPHLGPLAAGLLRPVLIVPEALTAPAARGSAACVLAHELAHVRLGHLPLSAGLRLACIVGWPLVPLWLASRRLHQLMELAADARALTTPGVSRQQYGRALLDLPPLSVVPLGGAPMSMFRDLRARVRALGKSPRWPTAAALPLVAALTAAPLAWGPPARADDPSDAHPTFPVGVGRSIVFTMPREPLSVGVDDESVVEIHLLAPRKVHVAGRREGIATVTFGFGAEKPLLVYEIQVAPAPLDADSLVVKIGAPLVLELPAPAFATQVGDPRLLTVVAGAGASIELIGLAAGETDVTVLTAPAGQPPVMHTVTVVR